ncbi:MAG: hypothetical protein WCJ61_06595, partial [Paludibacter sp.]
GLRETTDIIETMGIERSYNQLVKAEIVLLVTDISGSVESIIERIWNIRSKIVNQQLIIIANCVCVLFVYKSEEVYVK